MNKKIFHFFEIAADIATKREDFRDFFLGAIAIRSDGTMVAAFNSPTYFPERKAHAEFRISKKIDYGAVLYVARVRNDTGGFGMARPCYNCQNALIARKVKKVYYTINDKQYGIWDPKKDIDVVY